ncbi:thiol transferase Tc52 [Trypanosoma conorhini]|uniref:Thiol transferase Tc52 n=1 Tax=Trypanosoma conorhini TaxID=83891 RepID=A0A422Q3Y2_9TRYP|nr:thiol transferase Tc52 [Trypanosoma conorhini]RNF24679.1 thiol transferase Tc52 [Trypanosoma conorhini]
MHTLKLFKSKVCPYCQRVAIAAMEKKVKLEEVEVPHGEDMPQWYKELNPRETVPTLQLDGKRCVFESDLIAQYIDGISSPARSLMGSTTYQRHRVEFFLSQVGDLIRAYFTLLRDPFNAEKRKSVDENTKYIEGIFSENQGKGPYFLDEAISMADIILIPFLVCFKPVLSYFSGYDIFQKAPRIKEMYVAALQRPSVKETSPKPEEIITYFKSKVPKSHVTYELAPGYVLFSNKICPFADRARLACALKNVELPTFEVDLKDMPPWYPWINYRETVPTLLTPQGTYVHESQLVVHYIDEEFAHYEPTLLPKDAEEAYFVRYVESNVGYFVGAMFSLLRDPKDKEAKEELEWAAGELEKSLAEHRFGLGPFFGGATMNAADVSLLPMLVRVKACTPAMTDGYDLFAKFQLLSINLEAGLKTIAGKQVFLPLPEYLKAFQAKFARSS